MKIIREGIAEELEGNYLLQSFRHITNNVDSEPFKLME
jgi:hypothetical protein